MVRASAGVVSLRYCVADLIACACRCWRAKDGSRPPLGGIPTAEIVITGVCWRRDRRWVNNSKRCVQYHHGGPMATRATEHQQARRRPGRPRSERSRAAVLRATSKLMHQVGLRAMTTDEIANRSGVSKATIYKWWPNKHAVAVEAFLTE